MSKTISFSIEREVGYCVEKTTDWTFHIEDGDVNKIYFGQYSCTPMGSCDLGSDYYLKGDYQFERKLKEGIKELKRYEPKQFEKLIGMLNQEVLEKYFEIKTEYILK